MAVAGGLMDLDDEWNRGSVPQRTQTLQTLFSEIRDLAEKDTTSEFFCGVLNPILCTPEDFERAFQSEFDRSIKSRVIFRENYICAAASENKLNTNFVSKLVLI